MTSESPALISTGPHDTSMVAALCTPDASSWMSANNAGVRPIEAGFSQRVLPVEHRTEGTYTIARSTYPLGIILIPTGSDPTAIPAVLPAVVSGGASQNVTLDTQNLLDWGIGGVVVFV